MTCHSAPAEGTVRFLMPNGDAKMKRELASWMLVWCHEHCFKQSCEELHKSLHRFVKDAGGSFKCFKKYKPFLDWSCSSRTAKNYVLFTDWRQVKQCVAAMNRSGSVNRAVSIVVLCTDAKQQRRAQLWADDLTQGRDTIHFVQGASSVELEIRQVLTQAFQLQTAHCDTGAHAHKLSLMSALPLRSPAVPHVLETVSEHSKTQHGACQLNSDSAVRALCELQQTKQQEHGGQVPHFFPQEVLKTCDEKIREVIQTQHENYMTARATVVQAASATVTMAQICRQFHSPVQLERALLAAMPDHYED